MWSYWYLDFEEWMLDAWLCVRVVTATTYNSTLAVIERNKTKEFMSQYIEMANIPWMLPILQEQIPLEQLLQARKVKQWLDDTKLVADTKLDKERKENDEKIKWIQALLTTAPDDQSLQKNQEPWMTDSWTQPEATAMWGAEGWATNPLWQLQGLMW
jgi:hypothetical protein